MHDARWVPLEGPSNFRDLGGLPTRDGRTVRTGVLYRSDSLALLSEADVDHLKADVHLKRVVDLRSGPEIERHGQADLSAAGIEVVHAPIVDETRGEQDGVEREVPLTLEDIYVLMLERFAARFAEAIGALADPAHQPAVFHCAAGKDRTGLISALLLELCGVPRALVVEDFLLTNDRMPTMIERHREHADARTKEPEIERQTYFPTEENVGATLAHLDERLGGAKAYLLGAGVTPAQVAALRASLLG